APRRRCSVHSHCPPTDQQAASRSQPGLSVRLGGRTPDAVGLAACGAERIEPRRIRPPSDAPHGAAVIPVRALPNKRLKLTGALALTEPLCRALAGTERTFTTLAPARGSPAA